MTRLTSITFAILVVALSSFGQTTAFVGVNVIPMDRERVLTDQTVVVRMGKIAEIGDASKVKVPKDAVRVDGRGKYLIPGLVDMHTHLLSDSDEYPDSIAPDELRVMVANGVTTVRFMIGTPELLSLRGRSAAGEIIAPTIYVASPHLTGREQGNNFVVKTPDEARDAVRRSKATGYDFIKVTTFVPSLVYESAVDEAKKIGIRVVGHADSRFVGVERAWKAGQQIEHLDGYMELLLRDDAPMKGSVSDLYIYNVDNWKSLDYIDENKIPEIARKTVASNPFVDPTHHFMKNSFGRLRTEEEIRAQPDFRFYPAKVQQQWLDFYKRNRFINTVPLEKRARWINLREKLIKAIHEAGGKLMAGSDTPEFMWLYGFGLHHELKALKDAGISNYAVLAAGTRNAHEFFGTLDKVGTIEKGKRADLILLMANPLDDISATKDRAGVMLKGKWFTQAELNGWLDEIAPKFHSALLTDDRAQNVRPEIFGKDVLSVGAVFRGSFTADAKNLYFFRKVAQDKEDYRILHSRYVDGKWSMPERVDLGGEFSDLYPAISADGKRLVFASYRPVPGDTSGKPNSYLWYSDFTENGWGKPVYMDQVNKPGHYHSWVELAKNSDLYFRRVTPDWNTKTTMVCRWNGNEYLEPKSFDIVERLIANNPELAIAGGVPGPNENMIFLDIGTKDPATGRRSSDIYFAMRENGRWSKPKLLGGGVNGDGWETFPFLSPDGKDLYFVRDFQQFYRIPLDQTIGKAAN